MNDLNFARRFFDTLAAAAHALGAGLDRRRDALPRLKAILNGEELGTALEECFGALWAFGFGFWLLLPFDTFGSTKAFRLLDAYSVEWLWGVVTVVFGLWRADAILMNRECERLNLTLFGVTLCNALAVLFLAGNHSSPAAIQFFAVAMLETLSYRNQRIEAGK